MRSPPPLPLPLLTAIPPVQREHHVAFGATCETVALLLQYGADLNTKNKGGYTP